MEELNTLIQNAKFEFNEINSYVTRSEINISLPKSIFEKYGKEKVAYVLARSIQEKWLEKKVNSIINFKYLFEYNNKLLLKELNLKLPLNVESERPTIPYLKIKLNFLETKTRLPQFIREVLKYDNKRAI